VDYGDCDDFADVRRGVHVGVSKRGRGLTTLIDVMM
jgi:hypothetical protein